MQQTVNTSVKMSPILRERIRHLAGVRNLSAHALMLQALESYVSREEKRESWRQEGIAAWEEYQRTGLHLKNSEVVDWMDKVIRGEKAPVPKCHI